MYLFYFFIILQICLRHGGCVSIDQLNNFLQQQKTYRLECEKCFKYSNTTGISYDLQPVSEGNYKIETASNADRHVYIQEFQNISLALNVSFIEYIHHARCVSKDNKRIDLTMKSNDNNEKQFTIEIFGNKYYENAWDCIFLSEQEVQIPDNITGYCCYTDEGSQMMHFYRPKHIVLKITVTETISTRTPEDNLNSVIIPPSTALAPGVTSGQRQDVPNSNMLIYGSVGGGLTIFVILILTVYRACKKTSADSKEYKTFENTRIVNGEPSFPAGIENIYLKPVDNHDNTNYTIPFQPTLDEMYTKPVPKMERMDTNSEYTYVVPKTLDINLKYNQNTTQRVTETVNPYASVGVTGIDVGSPNYINVFDGEKYCNVKEKFNDV